MLELKDWPEITQSAEWKTLPKEAQDRLRTGFWREVVVKSPDYQQMSAGEDRQDLMKSFFGTQPEVASFGQRFLTGIREHPTVGKIQRLVQPSQPLPPAFAGPPSTEDIERRAARFKEEKAPRKWPPEVAGYMKGLSGIEKLRPEDTVEGLETSSGKIRYGIGQLAGFVGGPLKASGWLSSKMFGALAKKVGPRLAPRILVQLGQSATSLGVASAAVEHEGDTVKLNLLNRVKALAGGAATGMVFGGARFLHSAKYPLLSTVLRIGTAQAALDVKEGRIPYQATDPDLAGYVFDKGLTAWMLRKGTDLRDLAAELRSARAEARTAEQQAVIEIINNRLEQKEAIRKQRAPKEAYKAMRRVERIKLGVEREHGRLKAEQASKIAQLLTKRIEHGLYIEESKKKLSNKERIKLWRAMTRDILHQAEAEEAKKPGRAVPFRPLSRAEQSEMQRAFEEYEIKQGRPAMGGRKGAPLFNALRKSRIFLPEDQIERVTGLRRKDFPTALHTIIRRETWQKGFAKGKRAPDVTNLDLLAERVLTPEGDLWEIGQLYGVDPNVDLESQLIDILIKEAGRLPRAKTRQKGFKRKPEKMPYPKRGEAGFLDVSIIRDAAKAIQRYAGPSGGRGVRQVYAERRRLGGMMKRTFDASLQLRELKKALKGEPSEVVEMAMEALWGQRPETDFRPELASAIKGARGDIDHMSKMLVRFRIPRETTQQIIESNLGEYVTRGYKIFTEPRFRIDPQKRTNAVKWAMREYKVTEKEAADIIDGMSTAIREGGVVSWPSKARRVSQKQFKRRKDIPVELRELWGEITDPREAYAYTMQRMIPIVENGLYFERLKRMGIGGKLSPETPHQLGTKDSYQFGAMRGQYVDKATHVHLQDIVDQSKGEAKILERLITNPFKFAKTVANPATHGRQVLGNIVLSMSSDCALTNPLNLKHYKNAGVLIVEQSGKGRMLFGNMLKHGIIGTEYVGTDLRALGKELSVATDPLETMLEWGKKPLRGAARLYNAEDQIFKIAMALKLHGKDVGWNEIARRVNIHYPNYAMVPRITKTLRKAPLGAPFVSFQSEAVRIAGAQQVEAARILMEAKGLAKLRGPWKSAKGLFAFGAMGIPYAEYAGGLGFLGLAAAKIAGIDEKEYARLRSQLPEWKRDRTYIPVLTEAGKVKLWDTTYTDPFGEMKMLTSQILKGQILSVPEEFLGRQPTFNAVVALTTGIDPFTKESIYPVDATARQKAAITANYLYLHMAPPLVPSVSDIKNQLSEGEITEIRKRGGYEYEYLQRAMKGEVPFSQALMRSFAGIRTETISPGDVRRRYIYEPQKLMREILDEERKRLYGAVRKEQDTDLIMERLRKRLEKQMDEMQRRAMEPEAQF